jgi:hypothetical protein
MKTLSKTIRRSLCVGGIFLLVTSSGPAAEPPIDWDRARQLNARSNQGQALTKEEQAYLDRARQLRLSGAGPGRSKTESGDARKAAAKPTTHFTPLTELTKERYQGEEGGLYSGGKNEPPLDHLTAAQKETAKIRPLDPEGKSSESGKVVLLSIGMSNTTQEFSEFKRIADADPLKASSLVIVDGAQGGQDAIRTSDESAAFWRNIDERLRSAGVTPQQVQIVWLKQAMIRPTQGFPTETRRLQELLVKIVNIAKKRYPNLRVAYLSSRIYAGYATTELNPEPYAYESAFAVRWLIQDQIKGDLKLNYDMARGAVNAPLLLWGPYLWADGLTPRSSDGLVWSKEDLGGDGTHPSTSGRKKVADQLLNFFKTDVTARVWFLKRL